MALYVYPAIFVPEDGMYNVSFPDLPSCYTCGNDLTDAMHMAADALGGWLSRAEETGETIPPASDVDVMPRTANSVATLVLADTAEYRRRHSSRAVKKTLTIPSWLNEAAEAQGVNFSQALQDALKQRLMPG